MMNWIILVVAFGGVVYCSIAIGISHAKRLYETHIRYLAGIVAAQNNHLMMQESVIQTQKESIACFQERQNPPTVEDYHT